MEGNKKEPNNQNATKSKRSIKNGRKLNIHVFSILII